MVQPQETPDQKRRRLRLESGMGGLGTPAAGMPGFLPLSIEDEIKRNIQLETAYLGSGLTKPLIDPLPPNPTARDWRRINDALAAWIQRPATIPGTHQVSSIPADPDAWERQSRALQAGLIPAVPHRERRGPGQAPYNVPIAPAHQVFSGPMGLINQMGKENLAALRSVVPAKLPLPQWLLGVGIPPWLSTKAETAAIRGEQAEAALRAPAGTPEVGPLQAAIKAGAKDMPWGVKGTGEMLLAPDVLLGTGMGIVPKAARLGASAFTRAAPGLAARISTKFAPKAPIGAEIDAAATLAQAQAKRAAASIGVRDVLSPVVGAARKVLRRTPDVPIQAPRQLRLPMDTRGRPTQAIRPAPAAAARAVGPEGVPRQVGPVRTDVPVTAPVAAPVRVPVTAPVAAARVGVEGVKTVDVRASYRRPLVDTTGKPLAPDDEIIVYHNTTTERAAAMQEGGIIIGRKPTDRPTTVITDPVVARTLRLNVGDALEQQPGRGQGPGLYVSLDPSNTQFGDTAIGIKVRIRDLRIPPERTTSRMTPGQSLLLDDGYLLNDIPSNRIVSVEPALAPAPGAAPAPVPAAREVAEAAPPVAREERRWLEREVEDPEWGFASVGDEPERVVWGVKAGDTLETGSLDYVGYGEGPATLRGIHIGDPDFWKVQLEKDYGLSQADARTIKIRTIEGDAYLPDRQYNIPPEFGEMGESQVLVTKRTQLEYGKDWVFEGETFAAPARPTAAPAPAKVARFVTGVPDELPSELAGATPNYSRYSLQFETDLDKALFIVAQKSKSAHDDSYMEWLRGQLPDLSDAQLRAAGRDVRDHIKATVKGQPEGNVSIPTSSVVRRALPEAPTPARATGVAEEVTPTIPTAEAAPAPGGGARGPRGPRGPDVGEQGQLFPEGAVPEGGGVEDILGLRDPTVGLSRRQELANVVRRTIGRVVGAVPEDEISSAAKVERSRLHPVADNQAAQTTAQVGYRLRQVFDFDDQGRIPSLAGVDPSIPGAPTISDVAARFPRYEDRLSDEQLKALLYVHEEFAPYRNMLIKAGRLDILHQRTDIIDGGFYIPRGGVDLEWADEFYGVTSGRGMASGGKPGYVRRAKESSQAEGISKGNEYASLDDAIGIFTRGAARTGVNDHIVRFFKGIKDPDTGDLIGTSQRDRVPAELRKSVQSLKGKISDRLDTLKRQLARGGVLHQSFGDIEKLLDGVEKTRFHRARQLTDRIQAGKANDPLTPIMEADVILLQSISNRLYTASKKAGIRGTAEANKAEATIASIRQLRDELDELTPLWKQALEDATGPRPGEGFIDLPGLQGYSFPDVMASSMNKQLRSEGALIGSKSDLYAALNTVNNFYRGMNATMDNSAPGIQGLLAWWSNPKAAATALRTNIRAWHDPDALGAFLAQYDETAKQLDMPSAMEAVRDGVRVMGVNTEFQLGRGGIYNTVVKRIPVIGSTEYATPKFKVPGIRRDVGVTLPGKDVIERADRAFGFFGDSLRLTWYRNMIEDEISRGAGKLSIDDLRASGDMDKISSISNRMTGWTEGRAFGSIGDLLLFAPRFLQSRIETVVLGTRGLLPGAALDSRIARRSLVKMIAFGTLTTIAVNEAMGYRMTIDDFKPITNGKYNSNFMRIHAFGRKWSVFGTWDSLARALIGVGTGEGGNVLRGMGSGLTSNAWDLISGRDWEGRAVPNTLEEIAKDLDGFALHILEQFTPFFLEEIPFAAEQVVRGVGPDYPGPAAGVVGAAATLVGEASGFKSYPESFEVSERKSIVGDLNLKTLDVSEPVHDWPDLNNAQKRELIRTNSRLAELDEKIRKDRYERSNDIQRSRMDSEDEAVVEFHASMLLAAQNLTVSRRQYDKHRTDARLVYSTKRKQIWGTRQSLEADSVEAIENWLSGNQLPEDVAVNDYFEEMNRLIEKEPLGMETKEAWDRVNRGLERFLTVTQNYPLHIIKYVKDSRVAWIDRLPEPLRVIERRREREMSTGVWFRDYNKPMVTTGIPRPAHPLPVVSPVPGLTPDQQYRRVPYQGVTSVR